MWAHKKFKKQLFKGSYTRYKNERVFELSCDTRTISFESWQMAKRDGWKRVSVK